MTQRPTDLAGIVNIFPPEALKEDQMGFYQPTAAARGGEGYEFHDPLFQRIKTSRNKSHILVVGHGGCGKSTELRMLTSKLRNDGIPSITIEANEELGVNISYIDIFIVLVEQLVRFADDNNLRVPQKLITAFREALSTKITREYWVDRAEAGVESDASISASLPFLFKFVSKIAAALKVSSGQREELRQQIDPKMKEIVNALNALISEINNGFNTRIVIVIDGLEKCRSDYARKLFSDDISSLIAIETHLVVACPINIYRSPIGNTLRNIFVNQATMPMIKTHHPDSVDTPDSKGIEVIKELICKRINPSFFEEDVLENIIMMAGGSLRDTCYLVRESAFEAHMRERKTVDMASAEYTMNRLAFDLFLSAEKKYFPMLKKIFSRYLTPENDPDLSALLYAGVVFEYNGDRWVDLHPLIRRYIEKRPGMLD